MMMQTHHTKRHKGQRERTGSRPMREEEEELGQRKNAALVIGRVSQTIVH